MRNIIECLFFFFFFWRESPCNGSKHRLQMLLQLLPADVTTMTVRKRYVGFLFGFFWWLFVCFFSFQTIFKDDNNNNNNKQKKPSL